jgi:hypothetical protein
MATMIQIYFGAPRAGLYYLLLSPVLVVEEWRSEHVSWATGSRDSDVHAARLHLSRARGRISSQRNK